VVTNASICSPVRVNPFSPALELRLYTPGLLSLRHAITEQHVTGDIASPLTHCSAMMVSQLRTTSEHTLYVLGGLVLWPEGDSDEENLQVGKSTVYAQHSEVEWDYDVMALLIITKDRHVDNYQTTEAC
jgi:hypothetical protein